MPLFRPPADFKFPGESDRVAIVGTTGSGKTTFAFWLFSEAARFDLIPWIIVDYKGEMLAARLLRSGDAQLASLQKPPPTRPGIYVVKPDPERPTEMSAYLWQIYRRGKTGLFFDELSMIPEYRGAAGGGGPLKAVLTQGRSKILPVYGLVQRPVDVNLHTFSEAEFISEFELARRADRERVGEYIPDYIPYFDDDAYLQRLGDHRSLWYDKRRKLAFRLKPAPPPAAILDRIGDRVAALEARERPRL